MNVDELIATAQPRTEKVRICARGDLVAKHQAAALALRETTADDDSLAGSPATVEAASAVVAVEAEIEAATVEFTVQSVSRQEWANLLALHPPTPEQRRAGETSDPVKFPIAVIAACVSDPKMTEDQAGKLADVLHAGEWNKLWQTAVGLNVTGTPHPKLAAATDLLQANGRSSTTPPSEGSLEDDSLVGRGEQ